MALVEGDVIPPRIRYVHEAPIDRRAFVIAYLAMRRVDARDAERRCDAEWRSARDAANALRLVTAARHIRRTWEWFKLAGDLRAKCERAERVLRAMEAS